MKKNFLKLNLWSFAIGVALWTLTMLEFWCWMEPTDALGFGLLIMLGAFPLLTLVLSVVNAYHKGFRLSVLAMPLVAFVSGVLGSYFTFHLANLLSRGINPLDEIAEFIRHSVLTGETYGLYWAVVSVVGILIGWAMKIIKNIIKQR